MELRHLTVADVPAALTLATVAIAGPAVPATTGVTCAVAASRSAWSTRRYIEAAFTSCASTSVWTSLARRSA